MIWVYWWKWLTTQFFRSLCITIESLSNKDVILKRNFQSKRVAIMWHGHVEINFVCLFFRLLVQYLQECNFISYHVCQSLPCSSVRLPFRWGLQTCLQEWPDWHFVWCFVAHLSEIYRHRLHRCWHFCCVIAEWDSSLYLVPHCFSHQIPKKGIGGLSIVWDNGIFKN